MSASSTQGGHKKVPIYAVATRKLTVTKHCWPTSVCIHILKIFISHLLRLYHLLSLYVIARECDM